VAEHAVVEFIIPTPNSDPWGVAVAPTLDVWFTELRANKVGRYHVETGTFLELVLPTAGSEPAGITVGADGTIWLVEASGNNVARIDPGTLAVTEVPIPTPDSRPLFITLGPDGAIWFTETFAAKVGRLDPATLTIIEFPTPTPSSAPEGIFRGPDNDVWYTESHPGDAAVVQIVLASGATVEVKLPNPDGSPFDITLGPDGDMWFTEPGTTGFGNVIGEISPVTLHVAEVSTPTPKSGVAGIAAGTDGNVWFTETIGNLGFVNPVTLDITEIPLGSAHTPFLITTGFDDTLWFTDSGTNSIGEVFVRIAPGPCPPGGCPPPSEIDCVAVDKVFDFCFQQDTTGPVCAPYDCAGTIVALTCTVIGATCSFQSSVPAATADFVLATFLIGATVDFTVSTTAEPCTASTALTVFKTVVLCAPAGTVQSCEVLSASCTPPAVIDQTICTQVTLCETFTSTAPVQLLVPAYGYCSPTPCPTLPLGACPPSPLFPPQCT
jgi:virginiamycin B lyase